MKSDNYYYRKIYEYLTGTTVTEKHSDKYYLKRIAKAMGYEYEWTRSKVKYLRDVAISISNTNLLRKNNAIYYLRYISSVLSEDDIEKNNHQNYHLKIIYTNRENMTSNNEYYRLICEILNNADYETGETDVYYLTEILASYDITYASAQCKGKLLKDWASEVTGETYTGSHTNIYYLKEIEDELSGETVIETENNLLKEIYTAIEDDATSSTTTLSASKSSVELTETYSLSGTLSIGSGESVKIYLKGTESDTLLDTVTTTTGGAFSKTGLSQSTTGEYVYYAKYDGDETYRGSTSSDVTVTVTKKQPVMTFSASASTVTYGNDVTLSGTLQHNSTGMDNVSVKIYMNKASSQGETLVDTVTTSSGAFSKTISGLNVDVYEFRAEYLGDSTYNNVSQTDDVEVVQQGTTLNITVPLTLIYSDEFNITGVLTDGSDPIANATVSLLVGSSVVDSGTTDSDGEVSFTRTPVHMGTHTFQLSYAGDTDHTGGVSSTVTRDITKETSVLTVTSPSNTVTNMYSDGTLTISGSLVTDDNEVLSGETITVTENGDTVTTMTTDSNGEFSDTLSGLSTGSHTYSIAFATTSTHTASSVSKTVVVSSPSIVLASDKDILSYADSESATLTATYVGASVSGKTVSFDIVENGSVVENIGTDVTDANGVAEVSYQSKGIGDISIRASVGSILSEIYGISDCTFADISSSSNLSKYVAPTGTSISYDSTNQCYILTNTANEVVRTIDLDNTIVFSNKCKVSYDVRLVTSSNNIQPRIGLFNGTQGITCRVGIGPGIIFFGISNQGKSDDGSNIQINTNCNLQKDTWYTVEVTYNNGSVSASVLQGTTVLYTLTGSESTLSSNSNTLGICVGVHANSVFNVKNIKIQEL